MREITPRLTREISEQCGGRPVWRAPAYEVTTFRSLVEHVARLAYENRDELLFFRGQNRDYQSKAGGTTLYPAIYRGDAVPAGELRYRFERLERASQSLIEKWKQNNVEGLKDLRYKKYIQWSILQHYEVVDTPLLDLTHSLRVACSFAQLHAEDRWCFVYVVGLPYVTNRITINSEHDIVNIRLLSISPPSALRPYFQEGYLAGTADTTYEFDSKTELDFRNRLVAKFAIPRTTKFWGDGFDRIPESSLYPRGDEILDLCSQLKEELTDFYPADVGEFIREWILLEEDMLRRARQLSDRNLSVAAAISLLLRKEIISSETASELHSIRKFRNSLVHESRDVSSNTIGRWMQRLTQAHRQVLYKL